MTASPTRRSPGTHRWREPMASMATMAAIVLVLIAAGAAPVTAASPPPAASADLSVGGNIEVWLDEAFPPDVPVGQTLTIGATLWDRAQGRLAEIGVDYLRLRPLSGSAKPAEAKPQSDWPGHLLADVVVPKGGPGKVEVGVRGQTCTAAGACKDSEFPFTFGGIGPPPDAPRSLLVAATVHEPPGPLVAGEPIDIVVDVEPQAAWDMDALGLSDLMIAIVSRPRSPDVAKADLRSIPSAPTRYSGQITIPESGDVVLVVAIPGNGTEDQIIPTSTTRLSIAPGADVRGSSVPGAAGAPVVALGGDGLPWGLVGGGLALAVVAGVVIRRVFADL